MKLKYVFKLALKNLKGHRLRTFLTVSGVTIGIGFTVFLFSLGYGLQRLTTEHLAQAEALKILDVSPGKSQKVRITQKDLSKFRNLGHIEKVLPQVSLGGKIGYRSSDIAGVVYGKNLNFLELEETKLVEGKTYSSNKAKETLVTLAALKALGIKKPHESLGKKIRLNIVIPADLISAVKDKAVSKKEFFKIVGVIEGEKAPYVYVPLNTLRKLGVTHYSGAKVKVGKEGKLEIVKKQLENMGYKVAAVKETIAQVNRLFDTLKLVLLIFGAIAVFVASLGMFNTLTISLLERTREIGIMKALGTTKRDIRRLFLAEALFIGLLGGLEGIILAGLGGGMINLAIRILAKATHNKVVTLFYTPFLFISAVFIFAVVISFLTGFYPARRAARTHPLDALRYE